MSDDLGLHVHRWEQGTGASGAALLLLHGTGGDENDLVPLARMVAPEASLLAVRGNVLEQGAPRFFRRLAEGVFDIADLHRRTAELGRFIVAARERYGFAADRSYALGFSNGANIAASLLLSQPGSIAGGALVRAMVPFEPERLPALAGTAVLLSQGRSDPLIPVTQAERLAGIFTGCGADVELAWQAASHGLVQGDVRTIERWLAPRLG